MQRIRGQSLTLNVGLCWRASLLSRLSRAAAERDCDPAVQPAGLLPADAARRNHWWQQGREQRLQWVQPLSGIHHTWVQQVELWNYPEAHFHSRNHPRRPLIAPSGASNTEVVSCCCLLTHKRQYSDCFWYRIILFAVNRHLKEDFFGDFGKSTALRMVIWKTHRMTPKCLCSRSY